MPYACCFYYSFATVRTMFVEFLVIHCLYFAFISIPITRYGSHALFHGSSRDLVADRSSLIDCVRLSFALSLPFFLSFGVEYEPRSRSSEFSAFVCSHPERPARFFNCNLNIGTHIHIQTINQCSRSLTQIKIHAIGVLPMHVVRCSLGSRARERHCRCVLFGRRSFS